MNGKTKSLIALIAALVGIVLAIVGCWFSALGMKSMKDEGQSTGMAVAGLVVGIVGVVLGLIFLPCACAARETINALETYGSSLTDYANSLSSLLS